MSFQEIDRDTLSMNPLFSLSVSVIELIFNSIQTSDNGAGVFRVFFDVYFALFHSDDVNGNRMNGNVGAVKKEKIMNEV